MIEIIDPASVSELPQFVLSVQIGAVHNSTIGGHFFHCPFLLDLCITVKGSFLILLLIVIQAVIPNPIARVP